ncbi:MAG: glutathione S-transferase N-terminal domain-containing protein [Ketobacter sp.]|nr:MAG: hypothetical protein D6160_17680 [Ketobacter sp.]
MYRLIGMPVSPATKRVCWALDFADIPYHFEEYLPQITTSWVRLRSGQFSGPVSVPVLLGKGGIKLLDSWDIALRAHHDRPQAGLIPDAHREAVAQMNTLSEQIFYAGRILALDRVLADNHALLDLFPSLIPGWCRRPMLPVMRNTIGAIQKKYADPGSTEQDQIKKLDNALSQVRARLDGKAYVLTDGFGYADMTIIAALQVIRPYQPDNSQPQSAYEKAWSCETLATQYGDLLQWRDRIYKEKRKITYRNKPIRHPVR